uniref:Microfibril associated protein 2 n=1 Tax=Pavo cristatus TaxID=9049 RepID=A0A8C9FRG7_PAVCR
MGCSLCPTPKLCSFPHQLLLLRLSPQSPDLWVSVAFTTLLLTQIWHNLGPVPHPSLALIADCREEQYPCTRLYSVHKPCKQCLNEICFYSLRRVYVINKEICVRTVCAHEELLRGKDPSLSLGPSPPIVGESPVRCT